MLNNLCFLLHITYNCFLNIGFVEDRINYFLFILKAIIHLILFLIKSIFFKNLFLKSQLEIFFKNLFFKTAITKVTILSF